MRRNIALRSVLAFIFVLVGLVPVRASHITGMDLKYTYVSGETYKIICVVYGDCSADTSIFNTLYTAQPKVNIFNGDTYETCVTLSIEAPDSGVNIAKYIMCEADTNLTTCSDPSNPYAGAKKFVYSTLYTFPTVSTNWRLIFSGYMTSASNAGRASSITNIYNPSTSVVQLIDTLNNSIGHNTNPLLNVEPILFFCLDNSDSYNPLATDPDGDSLRFQLVDAVKAGTSCPSSGYANVSYNFGLSGADPLQVSTGSFSFDGATGEVDFNPSAIQRSTVVYNIREFRAGTLVGTSQREMNFIVVSCTGTAPTATITGATNGTIGSDSTHFYVCQNTGAFSFNILPTESNPANVIYVTMVNMPAGATYSLTGDSTATPHLSFSWNTTGVAPGTYTFYLKLQDNNCPVNALNVEAINITISPITPPIDGNEFLCPGTSRLLTDSTAGGTWSSQDPAVAAIGATSGLATGIGVGTAVISYFNASTYCLATTQVTVLPAPAAITGTLSYCPGGTGTVADATPGGTWSVVNTDASVSGIGHVVANAAGFDSIVYTGSNGCSSYAVITVNAGPTPISGPSTICGGTFALLTDGATGGTWASSDPSVASVTAGGLLTGVSVGVDTVVYSTGSGCVSTKTITVNLPPSPLTGIPAICIGMFTTLTDSISGGVWSMSDSALTDMGGGVFEGNSFGVDIVTYTVGQCSAQYEVSVSSTPANISGPTGVCPLHSVSLSDIFPGGTWSVGSLNAEVNSSGTVLGLFSVATTISYTLSSSCIAVLDFIVFPNPNVTGSDSGCTTTSVRLTTDIGSGIWSSSDPAIATVSALGLLDGLVTGVTAGWDTIVYTTPAGCVTEFPVRINTAVPASLSVSAMPSSSVCFGTPVVFSSTPINGGSSPRLLWLVNGLVVDSGLSYTYSPNIGDAVRCVLISDTVCGLPNPDTSNVLLPVVNLNVPQLTVSSLNGDTVCAGAQCTFTIAAADTGSSATYEWLVNLVPSGSTGHQFTYVPNNGDVITCSMSVSAPCSLPDPKMASDTMVVLNYVTPVVLLSPSSSMAVCEGNYVTINPIPYWGGTNPMYLWSLNGSPLDTGRSYVYRPHNGDSVTCVMVSNYLCVTPGDTSIKTIGISVDPVIQVTVVATPGNLITVGSYDTFFAQVANAGYSPTYQWKLNGIDIPGAVNSSYSCNWLANKDSVSCVVTTGYGTPCEGVEGFNWVIMEVAPEGVASIGNIGSLALVPNPNNGAFRLTGSERGSAISVIVTDVLGRKIWEGDLAQSTSKLDQDIKLPTTVPDGNYFLNVISATGDRVIRFVVAR